MTYSRIAPRIFFILLISVLPLALHAQLFQEQITDIGLSVNPQFPTPQSTVTVTLSAYGYATKDATIQWYINGVLSAGNTNARVVAIPTGDGKKSITVEARITAASFGTKVLKRVVAPSAVDIIAEPDTYVPLAYLGSALPSPESPVRVVAMPQLYANGKLVPKNDILFTWKLNNDVLLGGAQRGTNVTTITMPRFGTAEVTVLAETADGTRSAQNTITLSSVKPKLLFYETSSLYGTRLIAPKHFLSSKDELSVAAEPYYMQKSSIVSPQVTYSWTVEGKKIVPENPRIITLAKGAGGERQNVSMTFISTEKNIAFSQSSFDATFVDTPSIPSL